MDGEPGGLISACLDFVSGPDVASDTVFGSEQGHKIDLWSFVEYLDAALQVAVNACRVCDEADLLAFQDTEIVIPEDFDSRLYLSSCVEADGKRRRADNVTNMVARQHIITVTKNPV